MPNKSSALYKAKTNKADEFYTQYQDIENEVSRYKDYFYGKTVYCNCDKFASNFYVFFQDHFAEYGLKKLIVTAYNANSRGDIIIMENGHVKGDYLQGNGSYDSPECLKYLDECDIVCTNPPFSIFNEYIGTLLKHNKLFLIIGNQNAITNSEVFEHMKNNELWLGYGFKGEAGYFINRHYEDYAKAGKHEEGLIRVSGVVWYTNLPNTKRCDKLELTKEYDPAVYQKYDDFDAINVDMYKDIPYNYDGLIGVPITFMKHYNPEQFEIVGLDKDFKTGRKGRFKLNGETKYARIVIKKR